MKQIPARSFFEGYGEIITASILWGLAGIFAKKIVGMSAQSIIFYRVSFAFVIIFLFLLISGNLNRIKLGDKKAYLLLFSILQVVTMLAYFTSVLKASVSIAVLLLYTAPVYITVLSPVLLKESLTWREIIALVLSLAGIILIVDPAKLDISHSAGILAGMLAGIAYAFQVMTSKHISRTYAGYTQAFWGFMVAVLILLPIGIAPADVVFENITYLVLLAIFPTILAVSLYFNGLKKVKASSASILGLIEPVSAVILAVLILGEKLTAPVITGGALILIGAAIVTQDR
ncbi:MAG: DMT family transporter [Candidatus Methanoperedens sp.]|nr:DMT family transporter [Candidatus Methanoperedens sp.]